MPFDVARSQSDCSLLQWGKRARSDIEWKKVLEQVVGEIEASRHKRNKGFDDFENADNEPWHCFYCRYSDMSYNTQNKIKDMGTLKKRGYYMRFLIFLRMEKLLYYAGLIYKNKSEKLFYCKSMEC